MFSPHTLLSLLLVTLTAVDASHGHVSRNSGCMGREWPCTDIMTNRQIQRDTVRSTCGCAWDTSKRSMKRCPSRPSLYMGVDVRDSRATSVSASETHVFESACVGYACVPCVPTRDKRVHFRWMFTFLQWHFQHITVHSRCDERCCSQR